MAVGGSHPALDDISVRYRKDATYISQRCNNVRRSRIGCWPLPDVLHLFAFNRVRGFPPLSNTGTTQLGAEVFEPGAIDTGSDVQR